MTLNVDELGYVRGGPVQDLSAPAAVTARLEEIERELAEKQNALEDAAFSWFQQKRMRERDHAAAFLGAAGSVAERTAIADQTVGANHEAILAEARYEAMKAKVRVLETRASIGQSILRSQSRA